MGFRKLLLSSKRLKYLKSMATLISVSVFSLAAGAQGGLLFEPFFTPPGLLDDMAIPRQRAKYPKSIVPDSFYITNPLVHTSYDHQMAGLALEHIQQLFPRLGLMLAETDWVTDNQALIKIISFLMRNRWLAEQLEELLADPQEEQITPEFILWLRELNTVTLQQLREYFPNPIYLINALINLFLHGDLGTSIAMLSAEQIIEILEDESLVKSMHLIDKIIGPGIQGWTEAIQDVSQQYNSLSPDNPQHLLMSILIFLAENHHGAFAHSQIQQFPQIMAAIATINWADSHFALNQPGAAQVLFQLLLHHQQILSIFNTEATAVTEHTPMAEFLSMLEDLATVQPVQVQELFKWLIVCPAVIQATVNMINSHVALLALLNPIRTPSNIGLILSKYARQHPESVIDFANHPALPYLVKIDSSLRIPPYQMELFLALAAEILIEFNATDPAHFDPVIFVISLLAGMVRYRIDPICNVIYHSNIYTYKNTIRIISQLLTQFGLKHSEINGGEEFYALALLYLLRSQQDILQMIFNPHAAAIPVVSTGLILFSLDYLIARNPENPFIPFFLLTLIRNPVLISLFSNITRASPNTLLPLVTTIGSLPQQSPYWQTFTSFIIPGYLGTTFTPLGEIQVNAFLLQFLANLLESTQFSEEQVLQIATWILLQHPEVDNVCSVEDVEIVLDKIRKEDKDTETPE